MTRPSWIGQTLGGRYRIDDILGQGGMSAVYKAFDPNLKRVVAVKMIHSHLADDPKFVVRFEEEAAVVAQLRHPNIVQVFDFNHDGDVYYMVQEFVAGETLQERLRRLNKSNRRMALTEAIGFIINICDAAGYAHQRGLVHRDIKPANIMIDIHNQAILMDFGIVKITGGERHTATGAVVGTALYLPPELIRGEMPDPRTDQYSLAVTLFEAVSGRPPYEADSAMTLMMMHLNDPLPDLRKLRPDVPPSLAAVIEKALSKSREGRYASMADFASALRGVLASISSVVPTATATLADQFEPQTYESTAQVGAAQEKTAAPPPLQENFIPGGTPVPAAVLAGASSGPIDTALDKPNASGTLPAAPVPGQSSSAGTPPPASLASAASQAASPSASASSAEAPPRARPNLVLWGGIAGGAVIILIVAFFVLRSLGGSNTPPAAPLGTTAPATTQAAQAGTPTSEPSATLTPTTAATATPTENPTNPPTSPPTETPPITPSPTPTIPAGVLYSRINNITVDDQGTYVVEYETFEYTESLNAPHVHFFFNTVPQDQAGRPGNGPWIMYPGPRPFTGYHTSDRPADATQMCILVANADHSVHPNSGNCVILPDVNVAVPVFDDPCPAGPGTAYPVLGQLTHGQVLLVTAISADEAWWTVDNPADPSQTCWLQRSRSDFSGDISTLPLAEVPPLPEGTSANLSVQINQITVDDQGRYVVEFTTSGFTPGMPGTHVHFFFDVFAAEQKDSASGHLLMFGGASPFTGYTQADRPDGATQMCVLVANPDHTVIDGSGNCLPLPDVSPSLAFQNTLNEARSWPVAFQESFADNQNNWLTGPSKDESGTIDRRIENDRYHWDLNALKPNDWWVASDKVSALEFYLAATVRQISGSESNDYGLIFRKNDNQEYLAYLIRNTGSYAFYLLQGSVWQPLIDWSNTGSVRAGEDNRMEVIAQGSTIYLVLNGDLVGQYDQAALDQGQTGLIVGTPNPGEAGQWEFDDFEIRLPPIT